MMDGGPHPSILIMEGPQILNKMDGGPHLFFLIFKGGVMGGLPPTKSEIGWGESPCFLVFLY